MARNGRQIVGRFARFVRESVCPAISVNFSNAFQTADVTGSSLCKNKVYPLLP